MQNKVCSVDYQRRTRTADVKMSGDGSTTPSPVARLETPDTWLCLAVGFEEPPNSLQAFLHMQVSQHGFISISITFCSNLT